MSRILTLRTPNVLPSTPAVPARSVEERALGGQAEAWNELARKYNQRVVLALLARGIRVDTAQDLAQGAWTRLIEQQRLGRLQSIKMPGLVIKQALFLARDHARRATDAVGDGWDEGQALDPLPRLWAREDLTRARTALSECSERERRVFQAMYGGQFKGAEEVARLTGLSVQRVRQIHCEVRKKLRDSLQGASGE